MSATTVTRSRLTQTTVWVSTLARLILAGVLLAAGILKAIEPAGSVAAVRAYQLVSSPLATPIGWGLPFLEIGLGLLLLVGLHTRAAAIVSAFLLVTLTERRRRFRLLACASCGLAVGLVAVSRVYLDMHWLSDVIGGFTLGTAYLLLAIWMSQRLLGARPEAVVAVDPIEVAPAA